MSALPLSIMRNGAQSLRSDPVKLLLRMRPFNDRES